MVTTATALSLFPLVLVVNCVSLGIWSLVLYNILTTEQNGR